MILDLYLKSFLGLVIYLLLLQSIPVRAVDVEKSSAYRYQGPVVQGGGLNAKPINELSHAEETTRMKGKNICELFYREAICTCFTLKMKKLLSLDSRIILLLRNTTLIKTIFLTAFNLELC